MHKLTLISLFALVISASVLPACTFGDAEADGAVASNAELQSWGGDAADTARNPTLDVVFEKEGLLGLDVLGQSEVVWSNPPSGELYTGSSIASDASDASDGWIQVAPGVLERTSLGGSERMLVGEEGHRWALAEAEQKLDALYRRAESQGEIDASGAQEINAQESLVDELNQALALAPAVPPPPPAATCQIEYYVGPRSKLDGIKGSAARIKAVCVGGTREIPMSVKACGSGVCVAKSAKRVVDSKGYTLKALRSASKGCSAKVSFGSPAQSFSWAGSCG